MDLWRKLSLNDSRSLLWSGWVCLSQWNKNANCLREGTDLLFTFAVLELGTCFLLLKSPSCELERDAFFCTSNDWAQSERSSYYVYWRKYSTDSAPAMRLFIPNIYNGIYWIQTENCFLMAIILTHASFVNFCSSATGAGYKELWICKE